MSWRAGARFHPPWRSAPAKAPAPQVGHHQVGALRVAPVVEERDDVGVLQLGHDLRLALEPAHESRLVGVLGADHFDRHLAAHRRLVRPIDQPEVALAERLAQLVAAHRSSLHRPRNRWRRPVQRGQVVGGAGDDQVQQGILVQDALFQVAERRGGLDAQFLPQIGACLVVGPQRLRLTPRPV